MNKSNITFRLERIEDYNVVENLVRESFFNVYRPGCLEHYVLHKLRTDKNFVPELDVVMEKDGKIIGQNVFVKTVIKSDDGKCIPILTMGPICITKELRRLGYGKLLLDYSLKQAIDHSYGAICIEGNIDFYGKCGFDYAKKFGIRYSGLEENDDSSFFLCKELIPGYLDGITGVYTTPEIYLVDEDEANKFDEKFSYKKKLKLPGQIF